MKQRHVRLELNKQSDWQGSFFRNIAIKGDSLVLEDNDLLLMGFVCLKPIDSQENGFEWTRAMLYANIYQENRIRVFAVASDNAHWVDLEILKQNTSNLKHEQAIVLLRELYTTFVSVSDDFLLNVTGRYLFLAIELLSTGEKTPELLGISIQMGGDHMVDYLPNIYKDHDFTKRFLSIFDSFYMDMEQAIYHIPDNYDYERADEKMLDCLSEWVCMDKDNLSYSDLSKEIGTCLKAYEGMYTLKGVGQTVFNLCNAVPILIENFAVNPNNPDCKNPKLYRRLYGENYNKLFILLMEGTFKTRKQMERFLLRMRELLPANIQYELVLLKNALRLDGHTYLGINTVISGNRALTIDENTTIHYDGIIGRDKN